jgi:arylsulfatase A-like enzyme
VIDDMAMTVDLTATLHDAAGCPARLPPDGLSLLPRLRHGEALPPRPLYWRHQERRAMREGRWKLLDPGDAAAELYDLETDPGESRDLAAAEPARLAAMQVALDRWDADLIAASPPVLA